MNQPTLSPPKARTMPAWKLKEYIDREHIFLDAPYQRDIVWDTNKMSRLVDSILNNYYIPPLVFAIREINGRYTRVCVDGKQRLTAIYKFMNNEFPYIDDTSGRSMNFYFSRLQSTNNNVNIQAMQRTKDHLMLPAEAIERFNSHEFVCIEYTNLNEEAEYEVFNRIQLGVSITSAEKLRANHSQTTKQINGFVDDYRHLFSILDVRGTAELFKVIAQIVFTLRYAPDDFKVNAISLGHLLSDPTPLPQILIDNTRDVLEKMAGMVENPNCIAAFSINPVTNKKNMWRRIELLSFSYYLSRVHAVRDLDELSLDIRDLRAFTANNSHTGLYTSKTQFFKQNVWVNERVALVENEINRRAIETKYQDTDQLDANSDCEIPVPSLAKRQRKGAPALARRGRARK
ncbi:hypothetical protein BY458DRAFT_497227 [Sporodiniella umbellata]|nr:hypothetical protein BY458DRAFT_497227 [Sporodiniella umbellata]